MGSMVEKITANEEIIAIIVRNEFKPNGVNFITPEYFPLQMGVSSYNKGSLLRPHIHLQRERIILDTQEMVHVQHGKLELSLFDTKGTLIKTLILETGDSVFFSAGGHGWKTLEDSTIIEVKQGPYIGVEQDKTHIDNSMSYEG